MFPKVAFCCVISRVGHCAVLNLLEVMVSAVICMSLPWVWYLCSLPHVYSLFRCISFQVLLENVFLAHRVLALEGQKIFEIFREHVAHLHSKLWRQTRLLHYSSTWLLSSGAVMIREGVMLLSIIRGSSIFVMLSGTELDKICSKCAMYPIIMLQVWSYLIRLLYILLMKLNCHMKISVLA